MKINLLILLLVLGSYSCNDKEDNEPTGSPSSEQSYHLIQVLNDPGDGSGIFVAVNSNKTITFYEDGTLTSNGSICQSSITTDASSRGTYSETEMTIIPDDCDFEPWFPHTYELEGNILIINYPCIEACRAKFELIE